MLPAFIGVVFLYGVAHFLGYGPVLATLPSGIPIDRTVVLGLVGTLLAFALFLCTGMIYACLPFLREWASPLTVINYTLLGGASGFTLAAAFSAWAAPALTPFLAGWALILTLLAFAGRVASLRPQRAAAAEIDAADGDRHQASADRPEVPGLHGRLVQHARVLPRQVAGVPALDQVAVPGRGIRDPGAAARGVRWAARPRFCCRSRLVVQYAGLLAERWFFFAEANHPQNLYYQAVA